MQPVVLCVPFDYTVIEMARLVMAMQRVGLVLEDFQVRPIPVGMIHVVFRRKDDAKEVDSRNESEGRSHASGEREGES